MEELRQPTSTESESGSWSSRGGVVVRLPLEFTDAAILGGLRIGHPEADSVLWTRHGLPIARLVAALLGPETPFVEVLSEVFSSAKIALGKLVEPGRIRGCLIRITVQRAECTLRHARRTRWWPFGARSRKIHASGLWVPAGVTAFYRRLDRLPVTERLAYALYSLCGMSWTETGRLLRISSEAAERLGCAAEAKLGAWWCRSEGGPTRERLGTYRSRIEPALHDVIRALDDALDRAALPALACAGLREAPERRRRGAPWARWAVLVALSFLSALWWWSHSAPPAPSAIASALLHESSGVWHSAEPDAPLTIPLGTEGELRLAPQSRIRLFEAPGVAPRLILERGTVEVTLSELHQELPVIDVGPFTVRPVSGRIAVGWEASEETLDLILRDGEAVVQNCQFSSGIPVREVVMLGVPCQRSGSSVSVSQGRTR